MGSLSEGNFGKGSQEDAKDIELPAYEPTLSGLTPEKLMDIATEREVAMRVAGAAYFVERISKEEYDEAIAASLRVDSLLTPEQRYRVVIKAQKLRRENRG